MALNIPKMVRNAVQIVEDTAGSIRVSLMHTPIIGRNQFGPIYGSPVPAQAMMQMLSERVVGQDNAEKVSSAVFDFFEPMAVQEREKFEVNGQTYTVIKVGGLVDPLTKMPFNPRVWTRGSY